MRRPSLLSDTLLRDLMAAGQADVLVGIPTLDNAATVRPVVRAVTKAFATHLLRERTVLLNVDGGSKDGTPELVRGAGLEPGDLVQETHPLRTVHRISTPYHGLPGRSGALRTLFIAAELLRVRAVVVVDPDSTALDAAQLFHLVAPVLKEGVDYVRPVRPRSPWEGPLVTQLVRPLLRAAYGQRLLEPVDTELACSGRFAAQCVRELAWEHPAAEHGLDVWLTSAALRRGQVLAQVPQAHRPEPERGRQPPLITVFTQVVGAVLDSLEATAEDWLPVRGSREVPVRGALSPVGAARPAFDAQALVRSFREGMMLLRPLLEEVLSAQVRQELWAVVTGASPAISDGLWARCVYDVVAARHHRVMGRDQLAQALRPLYQGRLAGFLSETAELGAAEAEARLEALALAFEEQKPFLIERWNAGPRGGP
ncbi:MAG: hypothetical protein JXB05_06035 [Myxococcaceae bacterium]|nr:hypothetical protein [Myxococcaceae bacterium]